MNQPRIPNTPYKKSEQEELIDSILEELKAFLIKTNGKKFSLDFYIKPKILKERLKVFLENDERSFTEEWLGDANWELAVEIFIAKKFASHESIVRTTISDTLRSAKVQELSINEYDLPILKQKMQKVYVNASKSAKSAGFLEFILGLLYSLSRETGGKTKALANKIINSSLENLESKIREHLPNTQEQRQTSKVNALPKGNFEFAYNGIFNEVFSFLGINFPRKFTNIKSKLVYELKMLLSGSSKISIYEAVGNAFWKKIIIDSLLDNKDYKVLNERENYRDRAELNKKREELLSTTIKAKIITENRFPQLFNFLNVQNSSSQEDMKKERILCLFIGNVILELENFNPNFRYNITKVCRMVIKS